MIFLLAEPGTSASASSSSPSPGPRLALTSAAARALFESTTAPPTRSAAKPISFSIPRPATWTATCKTAAVPFPSSTDRSHASGNARTQAARPSRWLPGLSSAAAKASPPGSSASSCAARRRHLLRVCGGSARLIQPARDQLQIAHEERGMGRVEISVSSHRGR